MILLPKPIKVEKQVQNSIYFWAEQLTRHNGVSYLIIDQLCGITSIPHQPKLHVKEQAMEDVQKI